MSTQHRRTDGSGLGEPGGSSGTDGPEGSSVTDEPGGSGRLGRSAESYRENRDPVSRILTLLDIMMKFSSETHGLTHNEILLHGYPPVSSKTFSRDMHELGDWVIRTGHQYRFTGHPLGEDELMLLMDLARTSRALTNTQVDLLIAGIGEWLAPEDARFLEGVPVHTVVPRTEDDGTVARLKIIRAAIYSHRQISFSCFDFTLDTDARRSQDHAGRLKGTPVRLVFEGGFYVLELIPMAGGTAGGGAAGGGAAGGAIRSFRVDRMSDVHLEDDAAQHGSTLPYPSTSSSDGEKNVTLRFDESAMNGIVDRFGESRVYRSMKRIDDGTIANGDAGIGELASGCSRLQGIAELTVSVVADTRFFSWVVGFDGHVRIVRPESVIRDYRSLLQKLLDAE